MRDDANESPRARIDALKLGAADRRAVHRNESGVVFASIFELLLPSGDFRRRLFRRFRFAKGAFFIFRKLKIRYLFRQKRKLNFTL